MLHLFHILASGDAGATSIEYALIAALIAVAAIAAFIGLGNEITSTIFSVVESLKGVNT